MKNIIKILWAKLLSYLTIDQKLIMFESEGDLSDNSYALYEHMLHDEQYASYRFVWIVMNKNHPNFERTKYVGKTGMLETIKRMYFLSKCHYYFYDHYNFFEKGILDKKKNQLVINLWHGCGIKAASYANERSNIDFLISTGDFFNVELSKVFGVEISKVSAVGYPRTDYFYKEIDKKLFNIKNKFNGYKKIFLWMPTFRRCDNKNIDESYFNSYTGLPIVTSEKELAILDRVLTEQNCFCFFKIHHLQAGLPVFKQQFSNILIINDEDIQEEGLQLYEFLLITDALITDYSSIATDFMLLDKPIIYTIDDYEEYNNSRGFCFENTLNYLAGYNVTNSKEFYVAISEIADGKDYYKEDRNEIKNLFNSHCDGHNCERVLQLIGLS